MKIFVHHKDLLILEATILNADLLNGGEVFIGRDEDCHIQLDSHKVSRHHAVLAYENGNLLVRSLSEFKKVKVGGNEVAEVAISNGSQIVIDEYTVMVDKFEADNDDVHALDIPETQAEDSEPEKVEDVDPEEGDVKEVEEEVENETEPEIADDETNFGDETDALDSFTEEESDVPEDVEFGSDEGDFGAEADDFGGAEGDSFAEDDSSTQVFQSFASYKLKIFGEYAPFDSFSITENETKIGRDPSTCQIVLADPEVSKIHAVIKKSLINLSIEDNDSSNGIILNGERVNKSDLTNGDEFIIGETTFTVSISSDLLDSEKGRLMPVDENQEVIIETDEARGLEFEAGDGEELDFNTSVGEIQVEEKSLIKKIWKDPRKRLYAIVGILLLSVFLIDTDTAPETNTPANGEKPKVNNQKKPKEKKFTKEVQDIIDQNYALALAKYNSNQFYEAKEYINIVKKYDPSYKLTASLDKSIQESLDAITRAKEEEEAKKERLIRQKRVQELVVKAKEAVNERKVKAARAYFANIYELDPENIDVPPLKIEIDAYEEEQARIKQEAEIAKAKRQNMLDKLQPAKQLYLKENWYNAIGKLEGFLRLKGMDEDLIKEATTMLTDSKRKLLLRLDPLISKARSFKEGQDLKQAFETYGEVLKYDPSNEEALNERGSIFDTLEKRSRRLYREALIKEDLSDFANAKEKFQEVQQISPINSEYYNKASEKLKNYLE